MNLGKTFILGNLALLLVLGFLLVKTLLLPRELRRNFGPAPAVAQKPALQIILERQTSSASNDTSLFSGKGMDLASGDDKGSAEEKAPAAFLKEWVLTGTFAGSPKVARALIVGAQTKTTAMYKINDVVGTARIVRIGRKEVELNLNGKSVVLKKSRVTPMGGQSVGNQASHVGNNAPQAKRHGSALHNVSDSAGASGIEMILQEAEITPYQVNGQAEGLQIRGIAASPIAALIGLREGDVIQTINDQKLTSKQKGFQILQKARAQQDIRIELLRDDEKKVLSFHR